MTGSHTSTRGSTWPALAVLGWSTLFVVPHLYWAVGGRGGLGAETAAADAAFGRPWFVAYNLAVSVLAVAGALWSGAEAAGRLSARGRRLLAAAALVAAALLLARGLLGVVLLLLSLTTTDAATPPTILLVVEPWFLLGAVAYGTLARRCRGQDRIKGRRSSASP